jgi:hypothetical protein
MCSNRHNDIKAKESALRLIPPLKTTTDLSKKVDHTFNLTTHGGALLSHYYTPFSASGKGRQDM